ncbi:MAG: molybdenum ABC transporter ATP-binding protein [Candidatus Binatia bacterium]
MLLRCRIALANFELNVDASFDAGVTSIFGPSGSGKTTILDAIAGLRNVMEGEIEINGRTLFSSMRGINLSPHQRFVGYVPQEGALFPHLSVRKNVLFGADRTTDGGNPKGISVDHVLDVLDIANLLDRPVTKLSGGEAQRVALARAILSRPQLLLLDEPLAALDVGLKERILPYLGRVRDEFSIPMIYVTHNLTEVLTLAGWVLMIRQGRLLAQGIPRELLRSPHAMMQISQEQFENVFTVSFVESDRSAGRTKVRLESGQELFIPYFPQWQNRSLQIRISADDILLSTQLPEGISAGNVLPGIIKGIELFDGQAIITVAAGAEFYVRVTASAVGRLLLAEQAPVFLIMKTRSFRV